MGNIWQLLLAVLPVIIGNPQLQQMAAQPIAQFLRANVPGPDDVAIAAFLQLLAQAIVAPVAAPVVAQVAPTSAAPMHAAAVEAPATVARAPPSPQPPAA